MQFDRKLSEESLVYALRAQRNLQIQQYLIEPFRLRKVQQEDNLYRIIPSKYDFKQIFEALRKISKQKEFKLGWQIRDFMSKKVLDIGNLVLIQEKVFIKSKRDLKTSKFSFYSITLSNIPIERSIQNLQSRTMNEQFEDYLFGKRDKIDIQQIDLEDSQFPDEILLNQSQKQAVRNAMKYPLTAIQGPPGTGKTRCILALAMIFLQEGMKVMICTPSNASLLMITRLLMEYKFNPQKTLFILSKIAAQTFDTSDLNEINYDIRFNEIVQRRLSGTKQYDKFREQLQLLMNSEEIKDKAFWKQLGYVRYELMYQINLLCCTVISSGRATVQDFQPDVTIVDEAGQVMEAETIVAMNRGSERVILIGDQFQLLPVSYSKNPQLQRSLLARIWNNSPELTSFLNIQYRMHPSIANFTNKVFYNNRIINGTTVEGRSSNVKLFKQHPLLIVHHFEQQSQHLKSYYSQHEADLIAEILEHFPQSQLGNIGIITPFRPQLAILETQFEHLIEKGLTIKVIDGYQGNEKDYIIISFVRSNPTGHIGYLTFMNRTNVALTRARKGMIVVSNLWTMKTKRNENPWRKLAQYCEKELKGSILQEQKFRQLRKGEQQKYCQAKKKKMSFTGGKLNISEEDFELEAQKNNLKNLQNQVLPQLPQVIVDSQPWWQKMNGFVQKHTIQVVPLIEEEKKQVEIQPQPQVKQVKKKKKKEVVYVDISQNFIKW